MSENGPIVVLGGDGYLGWPLALSLGRRNPGRQIVLVDNGLRRRLVDEVGGGSLLPILELEQRVASYRQIYDLANLRFIRLDVNSRALERLIDEYRPAAVYHLAQQCSAPYSMRGAEQCLFTMRNNEGGNLRLLWAVRNHARDCHIIKLGSFGEYAKSGLEVAEGYFTPSYHGRSAGRPVPYPREADDFYHASKINDTNYISVACRKWGLRITDVMQSTIFGSWTPDIDNHSGLFTRLDYDECFGTVVNRFLTQLLRGEALTIYGTGHQRTGLMALNDSVDSLARLWCQPPPAATHRVINHLTEDRYSINELAAKIRDCAAREGFAAEIQRGVYDPRIETDRVKLEYGIERRHVCSNVKATGIDEVVSRTLRMLLPYRDRINASRLVPTTRWNNDAATVAQRQRVVVPIIASLQAGEPRRSMSGEAAWEGFRLNHFPYRHMNFNPGTLGTPSRDVQEAIREFQNEDMLAHPLEQYRRGRESLLAAVDTAERIWKSPQHRLHVAECASHCSNLLALGLAREVARLRRPLRVLTTAHEHNGGIGAFARMREFEVGFLSDRELEDRPLLEARIASHPPDIGFFSHVPYDSGRVLPVAEMAATLKQHNPEAWIIIDVSQSLGRLPPPFSDADVLFGSCHKWLFGPRGTGLMWTSERFRQGVGGLHWSGDAIDPAQEGERFSWAGGVDHSLLAGLHAALRLHRWVGEDSVRERSGNLASVFRSGVCGLLNQYKIPYRLREPQERGCAETGILTVSFSRFDPYPLYNALHLRRLHCKCIKDRGPRGEVRNLLRFGIPYYETETRLHEALAVLDACFLEARGATSIRSVR